MSMYSSVLRAAIDMTTGMGLYAPVLIGPMPLENGLSIAIAAGAPEYDMDRGERHEISLVLNGKHENQQTVLEALGLIHERLTMRKDFPVTPDGCRITSIETISAPSYIGREDNNQWLYGSSLRVRFYKGRQHS